MAVGDINNYPVSDTKIEPDDADSIVTNMLPARNITISCISSRFVYSVFTSVEVQKYTLYTVKASFLSCGSKVQSLRGSELNRYYLGI